MPEDTDVQYKASLNASIANCKQMFVVDLGCRILRSSFISFAASIHSHSVSSSSTRTHHKKSQVYRILGISLRPIFATTALLIFPAFSHFLPHTFGSSSTSASLLTSYLFPIVPITPSPLQVSFVNRFSRASLSQKLAPLDLNLLYSCSRFPLAAAAPRLEEAQVYSTGCVETNLLGPNPWKILEVRSVAKVVAADYAQETPKEGRKDHLPSAANAFGGLDNR